MLNGSPADTCVGQKGRGDHRLEACFSAGQQKLSTSRLSRRLLSDISGIVNFGNLVTAYRQLVVGKQGEPTFFRSNIRARQQSKLFFYSTQFAKDLVTLVQGIYQHFLAMEYRRIQRI